MHRLYGIIEYEKNHYLVNLSVEEMYVTNKEQHFEKTIKRLYSFRNIEIAPVELMGFQSHASLQNANEDTLSSATTITIPQLYNLVKTYDKSFYENPTAIGRSKREAEIKAQAEFENAKALYKKHMDRLDTYDPEKGAQALSEVSDKCDENAALLLIR